MSGSVQTVQLTRTPTDTNNPPLLRAGAIAVGTGPTFTRMWVGDGAANRLMLSNNPTDNPLFEAPSGNYLPLSGGTLTGPLTLAADAITNMQPTTLQQVNGVVGAYLLRAGGTMTGPLTLAADPALPLQSATKQYVDAHAGGAVVSATPPASPSIGLNWWNLDDAKLYIWDGLQWVVVVNTPGAAGPAGPPGATGPAGPNTFPPGITDGSNATAGQVGEALYVENTLYPLGNSTVASVATLSVPAGDWEVSAWISLSLTSAASLTGLIYIQLSLQFNGSAPAVSQETLAMTANNPFSGSSTNSYSWGSIRLNTTATTTLNVAVNVNPTPAPGPTINYATSFTVTRLRARRMR